MVSNQQRIVRFLIILILISVWLLVFSTTTTISPKQQQQDPFSTQQLLPHQTAISSQQSEASTNISPAPILKDSHLEVEHVTEGLKSPTSMAFIGNQGDMLILEKSGEVILFVSENKSKITLLNFTVNDQTERGLLGVAVINNNNNNNNNVSALHTTAIPTLSNNQIISTRENSTNDANTTTSSTSTFVFFYLTEASKEDRSHVLGNRIYRFEWNDTDKSLSNGTLILDLPVLPGENHNGGKIIADPENRHIYAVIGDLNRRGMLQNFNNGSMPDDTSVIVRINPDGSPAQGNPFLDVSRTNGSYSNLSKYYAYGIRNSFGLAIDPITGNLWDTENGFNDFDEINIIRPGFNSGWTKVMGPIGRSNVTSENDLVNFLGSSSYADPVFSWGSAQGVTDIEFYDSDKLGDDYTNDIFVGDANNGDLYYFEVDEDRSGLRFGQAGLSDDLIASNERQRAEVIFGTGFPSSITDVETGPDGYLYVLTFHPAQGTISRIVPQEQ
ncbi:MAG TPA: PQQ-dependent sugar dehydrogenase [Nitrososphaeraceae archaeon]|nr:PQQ-dependent sugar dehydrogenase [Nitrososphaeraceae archaeon]